MGLQWSVLVAGAAVAADASAPVARAISAGPATAWCRLMATDGPVPAPRMVTSCGSAGGRDAGSKPWPPGPRGATGGTASRVASRVSIEMHHASSGVDREATSSPLAVIRTAVP
jgi:hypothetical protein